jgi:hypothetical protein
MTEMGLDTEHLFEQCRLAGAYKISCMTSIGRDLSNEARLGDAAFAIQQCQIGGDSEWQACTRGALFALIDNTWDGTYGMPFCEAFPDDVGRSYCYQVAAGYLESTYSKSRDQVLTDCQKYVPQSTACPASVNH